LHCAHEKNRRGLDFFAHGETDIPRVVTMVRADRELEFAPPSSRIAVA
jgi:hypothetical protein